MAPEHGDALGQRAAARRRARRHGRREPPGAAGLAHAHVPLLLIWDQTLENLTGAGAPPWTWPRDELVIDVAHKAVFSLATGAVADALVAPLPGSSAEGNALGRRLKGFA